MVLTSRTVTGEVSLDRYPCLLHHRRCVAVIFQLKASPVSDLRIPAVCAAGPRGRRARSEGQR